MAGSGVVLGYLKYVLGFDSLAFQEGLGDADKRLKAAQKSLSKTADKFTSIGAVMSVGITAPFTALVSAAIPAAKESQQALGQVQAALTSMGDAAGRTLPQLQAQATALMKLSTFDDDDIMRKVTANLLTFGNVSGEAFDRAQLAAVNLSARLGQDLQSSAIQLGKALNNPVQGLTALSRVGVSFTAQQQEQIKAMTAAGNAAGAQAIILGELERQFGGSAEAMRKATPGIESQQAWADFQETVGAIALEVLPPLSRALTTLLDGFNNLSPGTQTFVVGAAAVAAAIGPVLIGVGGLVSAFGLVLPVLGPVMTGISAFGAVITTTAIPAIASFIVALSPILIPLAAVAAAVGAVYLAWRNWVTIKVYIDKALGWIQGLYTGVKNWLGEKLNAVFDGVKNKLKAVGGWFYDLYDKVVGHSYIPDMVDRIGDHMGRLQGNMVNVAQTATAATAAAFAKLEDDVRPIIERLFPERAAATGYAADAAKIAGSKNLSDADRAEATRRLGASNANTQTGLDAIGGLIGGAIGPAAEAAQQLGGAWKAVEAANDNLAVSFAETTRSVASSLQGLVNSIRSGDWLDALAGIGDLVLQLGGTGLFGQSFKAKTSNFGGFRAAGGSITGGKTYMVGERGPELFTAGRSGYITPNNRLGAAKSGGNTYQISGNLLTPEFWAQIEAMDAQAAAGGAAMAQQRSARAASRRLTR